MANTFTRIGYRTLGDKILTIQKVTADATTTTITAASLGMSRIECAWLQDVDDAADLYLSTYKGTSIVLSAAIGSTQNQLLFAIGS
jgi:hypothetical protein